ncbi:preprotein translocase subunit SecG [Cognatilysobacter segetis]|uniref:preprotein translocase subunit SecG n=1 Tax=Cognatilysobacter segetis TaxID=2492394 RepID=UPI0010621FCE|nr:preprotein translocase subunit SecG [Lysobacter segetis]
MPMLFVNIIYVLLAIAMIALILMQRGAGAQAGSGFGGGASGTVFGARGSANFLSKSTKWLAVAFFVLSLAISWSASRGARTPEAASGSIMAEVPAAPSQVPTAPAGGAVPAAPSAAPQTAPVIAPPAASPNTVPAAPATTTPNSPSTGG